MKMREALKASTLMGLFALTFSVFAFTATAAHAEPGAHWNIGGAEFKLLLIKPSPVTLLHIADELEAKIEGERGTLLTKSGLTKVEISCTSISTAGSALQELGGVIGKVHFLGCVTKLNGSTAAACAPHSPGALPGLIETNALDGLLKLHTTAIGVKIDLLEVLTEKFGETSLPFVTLELGSGECAIGSKFDITGKFFVQDGQGEALVEKVTHLFVEAPLSALLFGKNPATIDGSAFVSLAGTRGGFTYSGIAN
jgi:hypothetical protein